MKNYRRKLLIVMLLCVMMTAAPVLSACGGKEEEAAAPPSNPLTGELEEDGYDASASDRRVAAFVVENAPQARPQWGMDDENCSPDIVVQGEVEGGITRMLWLYADYNKLPQTIGPVRSARPPFIKFSELFDSIFIHWGMSHSKGDYIGADSVFETDGVDHINQMSLDDKEGMFDRDHSRSVSSEHTGIIHGEKVAATIDNSGVRTTPEEYTKLYFNETATALSEESASNIGVKFSSRSFEDTSWQYNEEDGKYHCSDFGNDFTRDNLLILYDDTQYITKNDYHGGGGSSVTYCDYNFTGGKAMLFSQGTSKEIEWKVENGKLLLIDPDIDAETAAAKNEEIDKSGGSGDGVGKYVIVNPDSGGNEDAESSSENAYVAQTLNKGKTWIGWISNNNGGNVSIS